MHAHKRAKTFTFTCPNEAKWLVAQLCIEFESVTVDNNYVVIFVLRHRQTSKRNFYMRLVKYQ